MELIAVVQDDIQMCDMCQERRESKISIFFWSEELRYEMTLSLILVPAIELDGDCRWCHKRHLGKMSSQVCDVGSPAH